MGIIQDVERYRRVEQKVIKLLGGGIGDVVDELIWMEDEIRKLEIQASEEQEVE